MEGEEGGVGWVGGHGWLVACTMPMAWHPSTNTTYTVLYTYDVCVPSLLLFLLPMECTHLDGVFILLIHYCCHSSLLL